MDQTNENVVLPQGVKTVTSEAAKPKALTFDTEEPASAPVVESVVEPKPTETSELQSESKSEKTSELPQMPTLAQIEKEYILRVLKEVGGSKEKAAQVLGVSTKTVYNKLATYDKK